MNNNLDGFLKLLNTTWKRFIRKILHNVLLLPNLIFWKSKLDSFQVHHYYLNHVYIRKLILRYLYVFVYELRNRKSLELNYGMCTRIGIYIYMLKEFL